MTRHTTNYQDTFIEVAEDCPVSVAVAPPLKKTMTAARIEYEMLVGHPYRYTSDDVQYAAHGKRKGMDREAFFATGQPCMRASALCKRYGWGVHCNDESKVALIAVDSEEYVLFAGDKRLKHLRGMRTSKA